MQQIQRMKIHLTHDLSREMTNQRKMGIYMRQWKGSIVVHPIGMATIHLLMLRNKLVQKMVVVLEFMPKSATRVTQYTYVDGTNHFQGQGELSNVYIKNETLFQSTQLLIMLVYGIAYQMLVQVNRIVLTFPNLR